MAISINNLNPALSLPQAPPSLAKPAAAGGGEFQSYLMDSLNQVNSMQAEANQAVESLSVGGDVNPAEVLTAVQKADLAFRMMMQIRNKLVAAYQEVKDLRI